MYAAQNMEQGLIGLGIFVGLIVIVILIQIYREL